MGLPQLESSYSNRNVIITGGLGFIGSNLAIRLVTLGANVLLLDSMLPLYGGNMFNIDSIKDRVRINFSDIRDRHSMDYLIRDQDYIFHLAGQLSHVDSITDPFTDVNININGTLAVLESSRQYNPDLKVIFTGTRGQYGRSVKLPVDENAPTNAKGIYAISNLAAEKIILMYNEVHGVRGVCLRITNTYGPRHQMKHNRYGVLNWFIRLALDGECIPVFGDGSILRDFVYVDDTVEALLLAGASERANGEIYNVGTSHPISFLDLAKAITQITGTGSWSFAPFTDERKQLEPGDYYSDISKIGRHLGYKQSISLEEGLTKTIEFYRRYRHYYWT